MTILAHGGQIGPDEILVLVILPIMVIIVLIITAHTRRGADDEDSHSDERDPG